MAVLDARAAVEVANAIVRISVVTYISSSTVGFVVMSAPLSMVKLVGGAAPPPAFTVGPAGALGVAETGVLVADVLLLPSVAEIS